MQNLNSKQIIDPYFFLHCVNFISCYLVSWKDIDLKCLLYNPLNIISSLSYLYKDIEAYCFFGTFITTFLTLYMINSINNTIYRKTFLAFFFFIEVLIVFGTLKFGRISPMMLRATIGTDIKFLTDFILSYGCLYIFLFIITIFILFLNIFISKRSATSRREKFFCCLILVILLIIPASFYFKQFGFKMSIINLQQSPAGLGFNYLKNLRIFWGQIVTISLIYLDIKLDQYKYKIIPHEKTYKTIKFLDTKLDQKKNIILVIGESSNPKHLSVYNPKLKTTPYMQRLCENNFLYAFNKVHSQASNTRLAVPTLISFYSPQNRNLLFDSKNIIEMANDAGYNTYWIGSQEFSSEWDKTYGFIARYSQIIATSDYYNNTKFKITPYKDDSLIPVINYYFEHKGTKNLYIIHLYGSHISYDTNVDQVDIDALKDSDSYDRSIHHTDRILYSIICNANKHLVDYEFIYVSDHGEMINKGHGFSTDDNEVLLIPLIMRRSPYCNFLESHRRNDGWISSSLIKYIILQMIGYKINSSNLIREIESTNMLLDEQENLLNFDNLKDKSSAD